MLICAVFVFGQKDRRNVLPIKWLQVVLVATAKCCRRETREQSEVWFWQCSGPEVERKNGKGWRRGALGNLIRPPGVSWLIAACSFQMRQ